MKIYAAAVYTNSLELEGRRYNRMNDVERKALHNIPHVLDSYHYISNSSFVNKIRRDKRQIFLDSGAFSAWTKGASINLENYCQYVKRSEDIFVNEDGCLAVSVLDAIGDAQGTFANQKRMEREGVTPLPCFHYGEDERYLDHYVKNYPYITLGGMVAVHKKNLKIWLDNIWDKYLTSSSGNARLKVHGFGLTTYDLLTRYPWYSVDSSSWIQAGTAGSVLDSKLKSFAISDNSPSRKMHNQHYASMPEIYRKELEKMIVDLGYEVERAQQLYETRWAFNLDAFRLLDERINRNSINFKATQRSLF